MEPVSTGLAKAVSAEVTAEAKKEAEGLLKALYGEPAKAFGGLFADKINNRRFNNLIPVVIEAKAKLARAGLTPHDVPLKIIHPMLEAVSLEDEQNLKGMWANLIAAAASGVQKPYPAFTQVLGELTAREAIFFAAIFRKAYTEFATWMNQHPRSADANRHSSESVRLWSYIVSIRARMGLTL